MYLGVFQPAPLLSRQSLWFIEPTHHDVSVEQEGRNQLLDSPLPSDLFPHTEVDDVTNDLPLACEYPRGRLEFRLLRRGECRDGPPALSDRNGPPVLLDFVEQRQ